jgi:hypothetical protein
MAIPAILDVGNLGRHTFAPVAAAQFLHGALRHPKDLHVVRGHLVAAGLDRLVQNVSHSARASLEQLWLAVLPGPGDASLEVRRVLLHSLDGWHLFLDRVHVGRRLQAAASCHACSCHARQSDGRAHLGGVRDVVHAQPPALHAGVLKPGLEDRELAREHRRCGAALARGHTTDWARTGKYA